MNGDAVGRRQRGEPQPEPPEVLAELGRQTMVYQCLNDSEWTMVWVSEGCRHVTGRDPSELVGNRVVSYTDLIIPEDRLGVSVAVQTALAEGESFSLDYRIRRGDGTVARVFEVGLGIRDAAGAVESLQGVIALVTSD